MTLRAATVGARLHSRRIIGVVAIAGIAALVLSGCTSDDQKVTDPSRVLQTVDTHLTADGSITSISDTAISVGSDRSSSATTDHDPARAAGDLPLRITTQYSTKKKTGTDLADLAGYSGRVQIDVTVENLTVRSKDLTYDVAGSSRTTPALVGAPFSIAASTVLAGTGGYRIVTDSADAGGAATDGVVSTNADGDAVVQWGRLLAPPTSGASSTLHLVADVKDFSAPSFDIAAQPGISTDLSTSGVMNAAFGSGTDSELALQRRTIDLVAQVNEVLARAGGTITEVRSNLETTSKTLGVSTAERLEESSTQLAGTMRALSGELGSLNDDLGATVTTTRSTVLQQLQQTTTSLDGLLGDTSATAPAPTLDGAGCAATPQAGATGSSVYGNLLRVSSQLTGYADASESCKQQVSAQLTAAVGPATPDATTCAAQEARGSLTCALWDSSSAVSASLVGLVAEGQQLADQLNPGLANEAIDRSKDVDAQLASIGQVLDGLQSDGSGQVAASVQSLQDKVGTSTGDVAGVRDALATVNRQASAARALLGNAGDGLLSTSMQAQNSDVANQICALAAAGKLDDATAAELRGYLTATTCDGNATSLRPGGLFSTPMDQRLTDQAARWDAVVAATDPNAADGVGGELATLSKDLGAVDTAVGAVRQAIRNDDGSVDGAAQRLRALLGNATASSAVVGDRLTKVRDQQSTLQDAVRDAFGKASDESSKDVTAIVDQQVRQLSDTAGESRDAVVRAFDSSIAGLRSTADDVTSGSKGTIDQQKGKLEQENSALASSVDSQTASSLQRIQTSTSASTRDVEGASTLLTGDLNRVMLDLGDRKVNGSGILGAMATSAAKSESADYQLALASQNAAGYANVRAEDVASILLQQEQFRASLAAATSLPAFRTHVPSSATATTLYTFEIGAG